MEEVSLLVDTLKQLDELFLSVVVVSDATLLLILVDLLFPLTRHFVDGLVFYSFYKLKSVPKFEAHWLWDSLVVVLHSFKLEIVWLSFFIQNRESSIQGNHPL